MKAPASAAGGETILLIVPLLADVAMVAVVKVGKYRCLRKELLQFVLQAYSIAAAAVLDATFRLQKLESVAAEAVGIAADVDTQPLQKEVRRRFVYHLLQPPFPPKLLSCMVVVAVRQLPLFAVVVRCPSRCHYVLKKYVSVLFSFLDAPKTEY